MAIIYTGMNGTPDPAPPVNAVLPQQPALPQAAGGVEHTWPSGDDAGQNGLPGNPGVDGTIGNHSENGTDCPAVDITIQSITGGSLEIECIGGKGADGGIGQTGAQGQNGQQGGANDPDGDAGIGQGGVGGTGGNGGQGGQGMNGGNIPDQNITILDTQFATDNISVNYTQGAAGVGGFGGTGGPGGNGGLDGNGKNPAMGGNFGAQGPRGTDGKDGTVGVAMTTIG
jgi:hypothetical protein